MVGEVGIQEHHGVWRSVSKMLESGETGASISTAWLMDDARTECLSNLGSIVGAAVVYDNTVEICRWRPVLLESSEHQGQ